MIDVVRPNSYAPVQEPLSRGIEEDITGWLCAGRSAFIIIRQEN